MQQSLETTAAFSAVQLFVSLVASLLVGGPVPGVSVPAARAEQSLRVPEGKRSAGNGCYWDMCLSYGFSCVLVGGGCFWKLVFGGGWIVARGIHLAGSRPWKSRWSCWQALWPGGCG